MVWWEKYKSDVKWRSYIYFKWWKAVILSNGEKLKYDSLVIATGAKCFVPPFENKDLEGVRVIRELKETLEIKEVAKNVKCSNNRWRSSWIRSCLGNKNLGANVTVLEVMPRVLPRQLDERGSSLLEKMIKTSGVNIMTGVEIKGFAGNGKVEKFF